jgi:hypothetical protein
VPGNLTLGRRCRGLALALLHISPCCCFPNRRGSDSRLLRTGIASGAGTGVASRIVFISFTASTSSSGHYPKPQGATPDPGTVICSAPTTAQGRRTHLFFHSLLQSPLTSAGLDLSPSHRTSLRDLQLTELLFNTLHDTTRHYTHTTLQYSTTRKLLAGKFIIATTADEQPLRPAE